MRRVLRATDAHLSMEGVASPDLEQALRDWGLNRGRFRHSEHAIHSLRGMRARYAGRARGQQMYGAYATWTPLSIPARDMTSRAVA